jgi:SAM-dependent methyltransferase
MPYPPPSDWIPPTIDTDTPSAARLYDYYLGGAHHFACDRELAKQVVKLVPDAQFAAFANRRFLQRAVRWCARTQGITQFIDVGCGLPTVGATHEVARSVDPYARIVYVDNEPVAVAHSELILKDMAGIGVVGADLRHPRSFLDDPVTLRLIDFTEPVAVVLAAVMHFVVAADDPAGIMRQIRADLAPGSVVVISHGTADSDPAVMDVAHLYDEQSQNHTAVRTLAEVTALFDGLRLVQPGVVWVPDWHPDTGITPAEAPSRSRLYAGVGEVTGLPRARTTRQATAQAALASVLTEAGTTLEEAGATDTSWRP